MTAYIVSENRNILPKDINKDYYVFEELQELKKKLNVEKSKLDKYNISPEASKLFHIQTAPVREYDFLRGDRGILVNDYNAEVVTNAWLKMYEILDLLNPYFEKLANTRRAELQTLHLAEAPGNFLLAFNHFLKTRYVNIDWRWKANSYRDLYSKSTYLEDTYGIMKRFPFRWLYGADCDGDISSPANIRTFAQQAAKAHIVTSDVKYVPENPNYNEEENYNIPVHLGHVISALACLRKGGIAILKHLTLFESASISLIYLLSCYFDQVQLFKPLTSKSANSEIYIICIGFHNIADNVKETLLEFMHQIRYMNNEKGSPALFQKNSLPLDFLTKIMKINEILTEQQIINISDMINVAEKNKDKSAKEIYQEILPSHKASANDWIKKMKVDILDQSNKLLKKTL
jgi:cap2 methyltransferase